MLKTLRWKTAQYFESRWWKNYLKTKEPTAYLDWKKQHWINLLAQLQLQVTTGPDVKILDAGCGPAGIFIIFPNHQVTALDPLIDTYAEELPHFKKAFYPNVDFITSPLEAYQGSDRFDYVFCMNAINHVSDIKHAMQVLADQVKEGGKLILSIDAHNKQWIKKLFKLQPADILHPHQYDLAEYKQMMLDVGITIEGEYLQKQEFLFNHYVLIGKK